MTPAALSPQQDEEAALLYTACEWPVSDIAEHFGVSNTAVLSALHRQGVEMRPTNQAGPTLRVKQCAKCLHFLPAAHFSWSGTKAKRKLQAWCNGCTAHPKPAAWITNPAPLAQAMNHWRN